MFSYPLSTCKIMKLKLSSANVVCFIYLLTLLTNVSIEANSVDPDQTAPTLFDQKASEIFQQTTKIDVFCCDWHFEH